MKLTVAPRTIKGKQTNILRKEWDIPCIVYGKSMDTPLQIACNKNEFVKLYKQAGRSTVIELKWDGIEQLALVRDIQTHPVSDNVIHVDFLAIKKGQKVSTEVPLVFVGVSPIEKTGDAQTQTVRDEIEIEALPKDLPREIQVDLSVLENMSDVIFVKDLPIPTGVEVLTDQDLTVATVVALQEEEEEEIEETTEEIEWEEWTPTIENTDEKTEEKKN